ncbi:hypothetical protein OE88DRAFT_1722532, partial [Heliocybe sulcata]
MRAISGQRLDVQRYCGARQYRSVLASYLLSAYTMLRGLSHATKLRAIKSAFAVRQAHNASSGGSNVHSLMAAFKDPDSPFYLAPGTAGPASPDEVPPSTQRHIHTASATQAADSEAVVVTEQSSGKSSVVQHAPVLSDQPYDYEAERLKFRSLDFEEAKKALVEMNYDPESFFVQQIVWGDMDSFQHVNNVRYLRFLESSRIQYMANLGLRLGGPKRKEAMLKGKGLSLIMKSVNLSFRRPVTYPDKLLIAHRPVWPESFEGPDFSFHAIAYSQEQRAIVLTSNCECVWYDYTHQRKQAPEKHEWKVVAAGPRRYANAPRLCS